MLPGVRIPASPPVIKRVFSVGDSKVKKQNADFRNKSIDNVSDMSDNTALRAPLAQLDRASDYGSEGREFESLAARHLKSST